jgi:two-component system chemotaxis response regulator CheY
MEGLVVLIADSNPYTRRLTRMMLTNLGIKSTYESGDGVAALDAIRSVNPDVMIMDWEMPVLNGREVMRIVRAPGVYPKSNLPVIMLTDIGLQSRVTAAMRLGVHEFLVKPISPKTLQQRLLGLILNPRPMVRAGRFYIPMPRRRVDLNEFLQMAEASASHEPERTRAELPLPADTPRLPGQLKNVHSGVGAINDVHVAPVVGF